MTQAEWKQFTKTSKWKKRDHKSKSFVLISFKAVLFL